jgi:tripartite-type tricarboxylate transporter receptor subunit TctC
MPLCRRRVLRLAAGVVALPALAQRVRAQAYPSKPLRWIVGFPPGGGADTVVRIMAPWLAERLGQPVVVENKPGASTSLSFQAAANAPPDGYTLLYYAASATVNVSLYDNLPFNLQRDIAPVSGLIDFPLILVANPTLPVATVADLVAYAKANPGRISYGSFGTGSTSHVAGELFKMMAGIDLIHVPYRGSAPMLADLLGGQIQLGIDVLTGPLPHIRTGALRALALGGKHRNPALPEVPTMGETITGYEALSWGGVGVPRGTPPEIIERLNREVNAGLGDPTVKARLMQVATTPLVLTPGEFGAHVATEIEKWAKVIRFAGVRGE